MRVLIHHQCGLGDQQVMIDCDIDYTPAEPMVRYYRDGSGYPGCPASAEVSGVTVVRINEVTRRGNEDWFALADRIAQGWIDRGDVCTQRELFAALEEQCCE